MRCHLSKGQLTEKAPQQQICFNTFINKYQISFYLTNLTAMMSDEQYMDIADQFTESHLEEIASVNSYCYRDSSSKRLTYGLSTYQAIKMLHAKNSNRKINMKTDVDQCTFQPKILRNSSGGRERKRSFRKFMEDQSNFQSDKHTKLEEKRQEKIKNKTQQWTHRPTIDRNSQRIVNDMSNMRTEQVFQRLSKEKKVAVNIDQQPMFSPKILTRSKELIRKQNIGELLYHDAQRRHSRQRFIEEEMKNQREFIPAINKNRNKYTARKVHVQFTELIETNQERISAIVAISVLSEIFNVDLNPNRSTEKEQISHTMLTYLIEEGDSEDVLVNKLWNFIEIILNCNTSTQFFSDCQQDQILELFSFFYLNRLAKQRKSKTPERLSFQPKTLQKSTRLASRHRDRVLTEINEFVSNQNVRVGTNESMKIQDLLIADYMKKKLQNENKKRQKQNQQLQQCSFKPKINKTSSTGNGRNAKISVRIVNRMSKENKNPCAQSNQYLLPNQLERTFTSIEKSRKSNRSRKRPTANKHQDSSQTQVSVRNLEKTVLRMSLGRQNRQLKNQSQARGYPKNQNWDCYRKQQKQSYVHQEQIMRGYNSKV